jgi:uncharacterized protein (TIGR02996 family)
MSLHDPLSAFYDALDQTPEEDRVTLLALADWYEEQGEPEAAECLRWTVRQGLSPFCYQRDGGGVTVSSDAWHDGWFWWSVDEPSQTSDWGHDPACRLPRALWQKLRHTFNYDPAVFKEYRTRRAAYEALLEAWPMRDYAAAALAAPEVR